MLTPDDLLLRALRGESVTWPCRATAMLETALLEAAAHHGVTPLLATAPGISSWPEEVRSTFSNALRAEAAREAIARQELMRLLAAFANAGVRPLLMKGAQIAYTHYPRPWLRPRLDTDLLIAQADRALADRVLRAVGYEPGTDFTGELVTHQFQYERVDRYGVTHTVDMHWKIANPHVFADALQFEELAADAVAIPVLGTARGLSDHHALLVACIHRVAHHYNSDRLIWLYDIHLLARSLSTLQGDKFGELARAKRLGAVCASGVTQTLDRFPLTMPPRHPSAAGAPGAPPSWLERLRGTPGGSESSAVFLQRGRTKIHILLSDLGALRGFQSKLKLIRQHLFPPAAYIRRTYSLANSSRLPFAYAHRIVRGVGKWVRPH